MIKDYVDCHPWICLVVALCSFFVFQLLNIIYGFDLYDTGFHLVAYENVFDAPDSVSYNFMYYLTNLVGAVFLKSFPNMGVIGFRIAGAMCVLITISVIFATLKDEIPGLHILIGSALVVAGYVRLPYGFNNGILSCCLYAISILLLYKGLTKDKLSLVLLSGIVVGLNVFTRIPNICGIGLVLVILAYQKFYYKRPVIEWKKAGCFVAGVGFGCIQILLLMLKLDHMEAFRRSILAIFTMSGKGTHSLLWMLKIHFAFYLASLIPLLVIYAMNHLQECLVDRLHIAMKYFFYLMCMLSLALYVYDMSYVYVALWGIFALGCILCIKRHQGNLGLFAVLALYMLVVEIYGSDYGVNHGSLPALLAAPVAAAQLINRKQLIFVITFILAVCWQVVRKGNFLDAGSLSEKQYEICSMDARYIHTTKEKADAINSTLKGIAPFVSTGDTLMCFPSAPMMNYLTHTRPAGGTCWIGEKGFFVQAIEGRPKILFNKTSLSGDNWFEIYSIDGVYGFDIKAFVEKHNYRKVFENAYFILYEAPNNLMTGHDF